MSSVDTQERLLEKMEKLIAELERIHVALAALSIFPEHLNIENLSVSQIDFNLQNLNIQEVSGALNIGITHGVKLHHTKKAAEGRCR